MPDILIDIETLPHDARPGMDVVGHVATLPPPEAPSRYTKPESIKAWQDDPVNQIEAWERGVFDWRRVRVGCIGIYHGPGSEGGEAAEVIDCEAHGEREALIDFMEAIPARGYIFTWGDYDARVLRSRLLFHGIPFGPIGVSGKPWDRRVVDLQAVFAEVVNGSPRSIKGISVDEACAFLGIGRATNPIKGSDVLECYLTGDWGKVIGHCRADVEDEWKVWDRLRECGVSFG